MPCHVHGQVSRPWCVVALLRGVRPWLSKYALSLSDLSCSHPATSELEQRLCVQLHPAFRRSLTVSCEPSGDYPDVFVWRDFSPGEEPLDKPELKFKFPNDRAVIPHPVVGGAM